jgi:hypothetical protein
MRCIRVDVLQKLPIGGWFVRFDKAIVPMPNYETRTYDDRWVDSIVWKWVDSRSMDTRTAEFDLQTGEYLGEAY